MKLSSADRMYISKRQKRDGIRLDKLNRKITDLSRRLDEIQSTQRYLEAEWSSLYRRWKALQ